MDGKLGVAVGVLCVGCAAVMASGVGLAVASGGNRQIHGCVSANGSLRVVASAKACHAHEKAIAWSKQGPRGPRGPAGPSRNSSVQLYANVDQSGDLGSNVGAISVRHSNPNSSSDDTYTVLFDRTVAGCAAQAQAGYAGGALAAVPSVAEVTPDSANSKALTVSFVGDGADVNTAFMITVTCKS